MVTKPSREGGLIFSRPVVELYRSVALSTPPLPFNLPGRLHSSLVLLSDFNLCAAMKKSPATLYSGREPRKRVYGRMRKNVRQISLLRLSCRQRDTAVVVVKLQHKRNPHPLHSPHHTCQSLSLFLSLCRFVVD